MTRLVDVAIGGHMLRKPSYCVCEAFTVCVPHPDAITAVVIHGWADVPAVEGVWGPTCPFICLLVYKYTSAWWGDVCAVEIILAVDLGPGGKLGIDPGTSHEVECQRCLVDEAFP